ncbi:MAG: hypothetical protein GX111_03965 [Clostridiales bacterium]|nr:hypothetical protein [Clostridiales bacterium]
MKKLISIIAVLALLFAFFAGCTVKKSDKPNDNGNQTPSAMQSSSQGNNNGGVSTPEPTEDPGNSSGNGGSLSGYAAGTPSESYAKYLEAKSVATEKIYDKLDENSDETWMLSLTLLPITMVDLALIPLSVFTSTDPAVITGALEFFAYTDIDFHVSGNTYTLTYDDGNGEKSSLVCDFYPDQNAASCTMQDGNGAEVMFFEFVESGSGYLSQYYYPDDSTGGYTMLKSYFDNNIITYGIKAVDTKPATIIGGRQGADFVNDCDTVFIMEGDTLTVIEEGVETVY